MENEGVTESKGVRPRKKRKVRRNLLLSVAVVLAGIVGFGVVAYERLQPEQHFRNLPVLGTPPLASSTSSAASASATATTPPSVVQTGIANTSSNPGFVNVPGVFNVLLIGSDMRQGDTAGHSDSMMIIHVDLRRHQYNVLSVPRDTRVFWAGYGYTKITSVQYVGQSTQGVVPGILDSIQAVTKLTGIPINYYAETNYWGLQDMVNAIGGINMYVPFNVTLTHPWYGPDAGKLITQGEHFLNGRMVTEVVHERYSVPGTDYGRQQLQEEAMIGIAKTLLSPTHLTSLPPFLQQLPKYLIATNMSVSDMLSLAMANQDFHTSEVHYYQLTGTSEVLYDDILQAKNDEVVINTTAMTQIVTSHFLA